MEAGGRGDESEFENNIVLQKEELEALSAIYGEDFLLEQDYDEDWMYSGGNNDPAKKDGGFSIMPTFSISIQLGNEEEQNEALKKDISSSEEARLIISFQPGYPTSSPPIYQLSIPWLRGGQKQVVAYALEELYLEHLGESIVYIWVEKLRELLREQLLTRRMAVEDEKESRGRESTKKDDLAGGSGSAAAATSTKTAPESSSGKSGELIECFSKSLALSHDCDADDDGTGSGITFSDDMYGGIQSQFKHNQPQPRQSNPPSHKMEIRTGAPLADRKSTFQAHVAPVKEVSEVRLVLDELYQNKKIAAATHNMYAYRILKDDSKTWLQDCDDDGETHAGSRLLHLLQILDCKNVLVVVSRWYGGIQLHADRFKHINNVARQALTEFGFLSGADGKKVEDPKSKKAASTSRR